MSCFCECGCEDDDCDEIHEDSSCTGCHCVGEGCECTDVEASREQADHDRLYALGKDVTGLARQHIDGCDCMECVARSNWEAP